MPDSLRLIILLFVFLTFLSHPATAQEGQFGTVEFPNSGAEAAQEPFLRGLALLHSFEYPAARAAFRAAQDRDPDFVLAYWGEAMAWNYPLWYQQFQDEALEVLDRLAPSAEERQAKATTERERMWLAAVETLYGEGEKEERDDRYERAMAEMSGVFPDDAEVAAFHALSILGTAHEGREHRTYMRAGAIATQLLARYPDHPGAAHYTIHSFDDPAHASLGLRAALAYSEIAPDAAHAQHMTSHIFLALGMWNSVVAANERADAVSDRDGEATGRGARSCGHYNEWLEYGYLMQGRYDRALTLLEECGAQVAAGTAGSPTSFADMRSRYVLDSREWAGDAMSIEVDFTENKGAALTDAFLRGYVSAQLGDVEGTRSALTEFQELRPDLEARMAERGLTEEMYVRRPAILELQLSGLLRWVEKDYVDAIALFGEAAQLEAALPHAFGPPVIEKPSHELLGEALRERNSDATSAQAFRDAVARAPGRVPGLEGLRDAAAAAGNPELAEWAEAELNARK
jgi:tetratricopeptide (TPR) repeat protein